MAADEFHHENRSVFLQSHPFTSRTNELIQRITVPSYSISPSAQKSHMQSRPTPTDQLKLYARYMTTTHRNTTKTLTTPFSKSNATQQPTPCFHWPSTVQTARHSTNNGSAASASPAAQISPPTKRISKSAMQDKNSSTAAPYQRTIPFAGLS